MKLLPCVIIFLLCIAVSHGLDSKHRSYCCASVWQDFLFWKAAKRADVCSASSSTLRTFGSWFLSDSYLLKSGLLIDCEHVNYVREVKNAIFSFVDPTPMTTKIKLVALSNVTLEDILDLDATDCSISNDFLDFVSGNKVMKGSIPMAHRYGGHQFGSWASQLGDGRAHLLGEYINRRGERWELQLKGSGMTPYSRRGDGRAVLRSSVREFLCSEALHHLGIPTSRAASLVVSDDPVIRDQFYNGNVKRERAAVVLRLSPSWFRIGSLEILESNSEIPLLRRLVDFVIANHFQNEVDGEIPEKYVQFYHAVFNRTMSTVVKWMAVGFAHGVCNTDNFSLLGLTIDFGPFGFVEEYDEKFSPNFSDDERRYRLENQPSVAMFNLDKLRLSILALLDENGREKVRDILHTFGERYEKLINGEFRRKLGLFNVFENDTILIASLLYLMQETRSDFTMTFRQLSELAIEKFFAKSIPKSMWALKELAKHQHFPEWLDSYRLRLMKNPKNVTDEVRRAAMRGVNPRYVLKNWIAERAISRANRDDFSEVEKLVKVLSNPFEKQKIAEDAGYADRRPEWANGLKVSCSS